MATTGRGYRLGVGSASATGSIDQRDVLRVARSLFGHATMRPGQLEAMTAIASGRDTVVVMPTGAGKSLTYQVPGVLLAGPTVVVSPLIALQRDQVASLAETRADAADAVTVNSTQGRREQERAFESLRAGDAEFFFLAPEQLVKPDVIASLAEARPSLFVVDEAHCVTAWGHDFRPDYLRLAEVIERIGRPTVAALTATAAPPVRDEIARRLRMRDPAVIVRGFDRPEIFLEVVRVLDPGRKRDAVVARVGAEKSPAIVYAATRRAAEEHAVALTERGSRARAYHAGMRAAERHAVQEAFMADEIEVVTATTAFGMGIDKPNIRTVIHADVADSIDSYYQEFGRAGRDGQPARAVLFYRPEDLGLRRFFASGLPDEATLRRVADACRSGRASELPALAESVGIGSTHLTRILNLLADAGWIALRRGAVEWRGTDDVDDAVEAALDVARTRRTVERSRVEMMRAYCETDDCRRQHLLSYFGEPVPRRCGSCDTCVAGSAERKPPQHESPFEVGAQVRHREWGTGTVLRYEGDRIVVVFDDAGYRTLSLDAVEENGLLADAPDPTAPA